MVEPDGCWITGSLAHDEAGDSIMPENERAICWCMRGAIERVVGGDLDEDSPLWAAVMRATSGHPESWNDTDGRTQAEVVAALRKAADLAEAA